MICNLPQKTYEVISKILPVLIPPSSGQHLVKASKAGNLRLDCRPVANLDEFLKVGKANGCGGVSIRRYMVEETCGTASGNRDKDIT